MGTYLEAPISIRLMMGAVGTFGGLISDADTKSSALGRFLPNIWHKLTPGHRRFTHSLAYCVMVFGLALLLQSWGVRMELWEAPKLPYLPIALLAGVVTHLFADGLTVQGVPLLYPFYKGSFRLLGPLSLRTGSGVEPAVVTMLLSIGIAYVAMPYTQGFSDMFVTPAIFAIRTEKLVVFMVTVAMSALVLTIYSFSRSTAIKRRRTVSRRR
ncbi:MAG: putative hydrolase [Candidatus Saccharibacteria bacterium]|nr:putative hydrolase [Candidatus Saccharibacteria bacterium]